VTRVRQGVDPFELQLDRPGPREGVEAIALRLQMCQFFCSMWALSSFL